MGFMNYLKPKKGADSTAASESEKTAQNTGAAPSNNPSGPPTGWNTPRASRPGSIYPAGDFRNSHIDDIIDMKCDVMVNYLHQQQLELMWTAGGMDEGVVLKKSRDRFVSCPPEMEHNPGELFDAIRELNVRCAMTMNTRVIKLFLRRHDATSVPMPSGLSIQILRTVSDLPSCQKHHFAAFIQDTALLVVWEDDPRRLLEHAKRMEQDLMAIVWQPDIPVADKEKAAAAVTERPADADSDWDPEAPEDPNTVKPRKLVLTQAFLTGATMAILLAALGSGWGQIAQQIMVDGSMLRLAFVAIVPLQIWLALFFMQSIVGCLAQIFGPTHQMKDNTKYYSGERPRRITPEVLPHVTIQCPVYKEDLHKTITPTVHSLKQAISTYEMQGGTANIFVNEDGMQLMSPEVQQARREFYEEHNIGWVSRPKHTPKPEEGERLFIRGGKFKKASNMNYCLSVSSRVEDKLAVVDRSQVWNKEKENAEYQTALAEVIAEDEGRTMADGNIRIGDYILIVDSDTRVPRDCFLDAVSEMEQSPQVAIIQYTSGVVNVTTSFFEKGITFFTNLIYTAIAYAVAAGDVAPFVGHNAILRWSALQAVTIEEAGEPEKFWSEETVSEDFDMALRLQTAGYIVRFAAYTGAEGFQEGVSLTVYDELARWEKYAYGCSELLFHPLRYWFVRGPFTPLFRRFMGSCMPFPSKLTIMAYIGTYYAIGSAWILTLANYFIIGWFNGYLDHYYIDSFKIFFSIILVFTALGNVALAMLRYRSTGVSLGGALLENFKWVPLLAIFLGGVSLHVSQAILSHMFSINLEWGATSKEATDTTFFAELPKLLKKFKGTFIFVFLMVAMMVVGARFAPPLWRVDIFIAIFPLSNVIVSHFLLPIALNPSLMLFTW